MKAWVLRRQAPIGKNPRAMERVRHVRLSQPNAVVRRGHA